MPDLITMAEFARRVGVDHKAVLFAIRQGRIKKHSSGKIDWGSQEREWHNNRDSTKDHNDPHGKRQYSEVIDADSYNNAKREKAIYEAKLKKLEYEERKRDLIPRQEIKDTLFEHGKLIRDSIMAIPERVAAGFASELKSELKIEADAKKIENLARKIWERESRAVLDELSREKI
jgi:hypothetical protein